uniref:Uncharacterized protein n=1 Tax=Meloidogyne enterolobii TaxID=390850 RepID=A0A6V7XMV6_MELEN|nr:unnamed protein product [Meloidogyne enterolobii]
MTEEGSSNSDFNLVEKLSNDLIKLKNNFDDLQIELNEEKEKTVELKKINAEHQNEIKNLKQNFQQLLEENYQKDDKINSFEEEIKKVSDLFEKKMGDLIKLNNLASMYAKFLGIKNKWIIPTFYSCSEGCGYLNLINDENIKYFVNNLEGGYDRFRLVSAENSFNKPQHCSAYSLYYFEIKWIFEEFPERSTPWLSIGLRNCTTKEHTIYNVSASANRIFHNQYSNLAYRLSTIFNNNDIFGCGLVYPSANKMDEDFPYIFFTQNGKVIGKALSLRKDDLSSYKPFIILHCCSVEANFGSNLETKPFKYDVTKHRVLQEFY